MLSNSEIEKELFTKLKSVFSYNSETGIFTNKADRHRAKKGQIAGCKRDAHGNVLSFRGTKIMARRLAWFFLYGEVPICFVQNKDGDIFNDSKDNLIQINGVDRRLSGKTRKDSVSGITGISYVKKKNKWRAYACCIDFGCFNSKKEAIQARKIFLKSRKK